MSENTNQAVPLNPSDSRNSFEMSPTIGKLAEALCAAQKEIKGAAKSADNPFYKSKYADLAEVIAAGKPLQEHGIAVTQFPVDGAEGRVSLVTLMMHTSGEWMKGTFSMKPTKPDPQGEGSVLTYSRRYCYAAAAGIPQVDDDGNAASGKTDKPAKVSESKPQPVTAKGKFSEFTTRQAEDGETEVWGKVGDRVVFSSADPSRTALIDLHESALDAEFVLMNTGRNAKNGTPIYSVHMVSPIPTQVPDDKVKPALAVSIKEARKAQ